MGGAEKGDYQAGHISTKFQNFLIKLLVGAVRASLIVKRLLKGLFLVLGKGAWWVGRKMILPVLIRIYGVMVRIRRALRPAERRFVLITTHRSILHAAIIGVALTTAGGNIYAQTQATTSSGEQSVLYKYITGDDSTVEKSGPPTADDQQFAADAANANNPSSTDGTDQTLDQGSDAMTELGALMPETVPGSGTVAHRSQTEQYVVLPGDTLSDIADKFGISIATILWENNLTVHDFIKPGQTLSILPTTGITYKVKSGDTIAKIAAANGVDPQDIKSWNNLADDATIAMGQALIIPGGKITPPPAPKPKPRAIASPVQIFAKPPDLAAGSKNTTDMVWPTTSHYITQPYGIWSFVDHGIHTGVDLGAPKGTPIYAADDGIVTHSGCGVSCATGYGYYIDIDHGNGISTRYGHTSQRFVKVGEQVHKGETIGLVGSTGHSTGPHLHFEVRVNGHYVNPLPYIE